MRHNNRCLRDSSAIVRPTAAAAEADGSILRGALPEASQVATNSCARDGTSAAPYTHLRHSGSGRYGGFLREAMAKEREALADAVAVAPSRSRAALAERAVRVWTRSVLWF